MYFGQASTGDGEFNKDKGTQTVIVSMKYDFLTTKTTFE